MGAQYSKYSVLILHMYNPFSSKGYLLNNWLNRLKHCPLRLEQLLKTTHKEFWSKKNTKAYIHHTHDTGKVS